MIVPGRVLQSRPPTVGAVLLALLYLATAAVPALAARLFGRPRQRPSAWAVAVLTLLPLAFTASGFLPGKALTPTPLLAGVAPWADPALTAQVAAGSQPVNPLLLDPVSQMIPWRRAARDGLLFNPAEGGGAALLGNGQSALLFPTEALARLLTPFRAVTYSQAARLLIAVWGMFLLARALAASETAALIAAAAFAGAGFLELWRLHPHSLVAATAPWIVLAALAVGRRPGPRSAVALAAAGAVGFAGGHPETLLHVLLFTAVLAAPAAVVAARRASRRADAGAGLGRPLAHRLLWGGVAGLLALALAAPALLPFLGNLRVSSEWRHGRAERRLQTETSVSDAVERLAPPAALLALGDPRDDTWRGPENLAELGGGAMGSVALLLAALAFFAPAGAVGRARRRRALLLLVLGLLGLLVAAHVPWLSKPFGWVPLLRDSLLKRLSLWWALAVPPLAAWGFDRARRSARARRTALTATAGVALLLAVAANYAPAAARPRIFVTELLPLLVAAAALSALLTAARRSGGTRAGRAPLALAVLAVAVVLPRVALFADWVPAATADGFYPETLATRFVADALAAAGPAGWRVAGLDAALVPHAAAFFGFDEARTYDPMGFAPYRSFLAALGEVPRTGWVRILDPARPALAFLGVRWVFDHPSMTARPGVEVAYAGRDAIVYEVPGALPRLFVPRTLTVMPDAEAAVVAAREIDDFAQRDVVDRAPAGLAASEESGAGEPLANGAATVSDLAVGRGRVRATVEAAGPAIVASSQPAIPGWRLRVDGRAAEAARVTVNGAFLGVAVAAGRHELELRYAPASWPRGLALFVLGLAVAAVLVAAERRRRPGAA
jgi:hypothetical protein